MEQYYSVKKRPKDDLSDDDIEFKTILRHWKLLQYADVLEEEGWEDPELWTELDENALMQMGFKPGHRKKFTKNVQKTYGNNMNDNISKPEEIEEKQRTDPMTKLPFKDTMEQRLLAICNHNSANVAALISADMDNMKHLNNKGHHVADAVIQSVGLIVKKQTENNGVEAFRYYQGGDEFGLIITGKDKDAVIAIAENLNKSIDESTKTTMSMGVAIRRDNEIKDVWFKRAEDALKRAKDNGKNMVVFENDNIKKNDQISETTVVDVSAKQQLQTQNQFQNIVQQQQNVFAADWSCYNGTYRVDNISGSAFNCSHFIGQTGTLSNGSWVCVALGHQWFGWPLPNIDGKAFNFGAVITYKWNHQAKRCMEFIFKDATGTWNWKLVQ